MKKRIRLTESQLHKLIEQALNELDWKTYDWAAKHANDAMTAFRGDDDDICFGDLSCYPDYSNPLVRRAIIYTLSKKYGRKNVIPFINGMSDEQLEDFMDDLDCKPEVMSDLFDRVNNFNKAATQTFANKYGHKVSTNDPEFSTVDQEGNEWERFSRPTITNDENTIARVSDRNPYSFSWVKTEPYWDVNDDEEDGLDVDHLNDIVNSDAAQDLLNNYADNYEYVKGKGWQLKQNNESLARRVTESIIKKLRRV